MTDKTREKIEAMAKVECAKGEGGYRVSMGWYKAGATPWAEQAEKLAEALGMFGGQCACAGMGIDFSKCECAACSKTKALARWKAFNE